MNLASVHLSPNIVHHFYPNLDRWVLTKCDDIKWWHWSTKYLHPQTSGATVQCGNGLESMCMSVERWTVCVSGARTASVIVTPCHCVNQCYGFRHYTVLARLASQAQRSSSRRSPLYQLIGSIHNTVSDGWSGDWLCLLKHRCGGELELPLIHPGEGQ